MEIRLKLNKNFVACMNRLREKYGEEFEKINGLHQSNLNYTDFIDNFIDIENPVDATIDSNSNSSVKDIRSLLTEIEKPHTKLLSFNKIFYEITKKYGLIVAEEWLEDEWSGALYMHDAPSSSLYSYSYFGKETILIKYKNKINLVCFEDLYDMVEAKETLLNENDGAYAKHPKELQVWDNNLWTNVPRIIKKNKTNDFMFIKGSNGVSQIVTTNHPIITTIGDINASNVTTDHYITTFKPSVPFGKVKYINIVEKLIKSDNLKKEILFNGELIKEDIIYKTGQVSFKNHQSIINNILELTEEFGWLYGMILSEGTLANNVVISQNDGEIFNKITSILIKMNLPFTISKNKKCNKIIIRSVIFKEILINIFEYKNGAFNKKLPINFLEYNKEFLKGVVGGLLDGDGTLMLKTNRRITVRLTSRLLLNQISFIVQMMGYNVRDAKPLFNNNDIIKKDRSYKQTKYLYQIAFTPYSDGETFNSIKIKNNVDSYTTKTIGQKYCNSQYTFGYGNVKVGNVTLLDKYDEKYVYDITTDTHTFTCNNIHSHNCYAYELKDLVEKGLYFLPKTNTSVAKHLTTFAAHLRELIVWVSNRTSGACALPSFFIYSYYFWKKDVEDNFYLKNPEYYRRQFFQQFIFEINQIHGRITQSPFTNIIVMDRNYITEIFGDRQYPDGTYIIDDIEEIIEHQKVFMEVVSETRKLVMLTFPVITYSLLFQNGKFIDEEFAKWCNKHNMEWYDSNFYIGDTVTNLASCCRMTNDVSKLDKQFLSSIGGSLTEIGSVKVSTINLMRIAIESEGDKEKYLQILEKRIRLNIAVLDIIRNIIKRNVEKGLLPNYTHKVIKLENQSVTNGATAMYETIDNFGLISTDELGNKYYTNEGIEFASQIMDKINEVQDSYDLGYNIGIEIIPAETANIKLCKKDNLLYKKDKHFIYSNQWIPLTEKCTIKEKIRLGAILDKKCNGGQILHINLQGKFTNEKQAWELLNHIANSGVLYFAFNPKISVCKNNHGFFGNICPICGGEKTDEYSRIVGFLVATNNYSKERREEYYSRKWYSLDD